MPASIIKLEWNPQPDITAYELAQCMPYLLDINRIIPTASIDLNQDFFRNFNVIELN